MYNAPFGIGIRGYGHAVGTRSLSNEALMAEFDIRLKSSFIDNNIGIKTRHFIEDDTSTSDLATTAAQQALASAGISVAELDRLIVATSTPDYLSPSTACVVQYKLGGRGFPAHDISAACSGFIYAIDQAIRYIATGDDNVLVIGADARSRTLDPQDRRTAFLYGDAAGAVVISRNRKSGRGFISSTLFADGIGHDAVFVPSVGHPRTPAALPSLLTMPDGKRVSENAGIGIPGLCARVLEQTTHTQADIDFYLLHQPNLYLLRAVCDYMQIPDDRTLINFPDYGNTVAASIPLALSQAAAQHRLKPGDLVLMCAVGGGFTGGAHLLHWLAPDDFAA
jgi:3-oxoacyl-[acyl-carrier-protein] synthase-3